MITKSELESTKKIIGTSVAKKPAKSKEVG